MADDWAPRAGHAGERCFCADARAAPIFGAGRGVHRDGFQWKSIASGSGCNDQALSLRIFSASTHSARLSDTVRSMLPTGRVCRRRPWALRPGCPPCMTFD